MSTMMVRNIQIAIAAAVGIFAGKKTVEILRGFDEACCDDDCDDINTLSDDELDDAF